MAVGRTLAIAGMHSKWNQELGDESLEILRVDMERLARKYGAKAIEQALAEMRIEPGRRFFPQASEICRDIEGLWQSKRQKSVQNTSIRNCSVCDNMRMVVEQNRTGDGSLTTGNAW